MSSEVAISNLLKPEALSVGYADNAALPLGAYATFRGQAVDDTALLMAVTRTGDANLDGIVGDDDVTIVGTKYAPGVPQPYWAFGDFDYDGFVNDDDVTLLGVFYNQDAPPFAVTESPTTETVISVPEPAGITLVAAVVLTAMAHTRRRLRLREKKPQ